MTSVLGDMQLVPALVSAAQRPVRRGDSPRGGHRELSSDERTRLGGLRQALPERLAFCGNELTPAEKALLLALVEYHARGDLVPSQGVLGPLVGLGERRLRGAYNELRARGFVLVTTMGSCPSEVRLNIDCLGAWVDSAAFAWGRPAAVSGGASLGRNQHLQNVGTNPSIPPIPLPPQPPPPAPQAPSLDPGQPGRPTTNHPSPPGTAPDEDGSDRQHVEAKLAECLFSFSRPTVAEILERLADGRSTRAEFNYACREGDIRNIRTYVYFEKILKRKECQRRAAGTRAKASWTGADDSRAPLPIDAFRRGELG